MISDSKALRLIAILFLLTAISSVITFFLSFTHQTLFLPWGILGFWIFFRLPACRRPWRTVAIVLLLIPICLMPMIAVAAITSGAPTYIEVFGLRVAEVNLSTFLLWTTIFWSLNFWQFLVLMRPSIRQAFLAPDAAVPNRAAF